MTLARVIDVDFSPSIKIQVIKHDHDTCIGMITSVDEADMDLVDLDPEIIHDIEKEQRCENCEHCYVRFTECYMFDKKIDTNRNVLENLVLAISREKRKYFHKLEKIDIGK